MSQKVKKQIASAINTFVGTFITTFGAAMLALPADTWTEAGWKLAILSIATSAVRAAWKAVAGSVFPSLS